MKIAPFSALLIVAAFCVSGQQDPGASQTAAFPVSKVAMIYSDAFLDPKTGITKFNNLLGILNREFQPRQAELQSLQTRAQTLAKEIEETQSVADPNSIRTKRDQLEQMNTDIKRKAEDAEAAYNKRRQEIFLPLQKGHRQCRRSVCKSKKYHRDNRRRQCTYDLCRPKYRYNACILSERQSFSAHRGGEGA